MNVQQGGGNRPKQQPRRQNRPKQNKPKKRPQKPRPAQRQQQARPANNNQQARPQSNNQARPQPSVMCPSAMLCVPKPNCDFKGIITDIPLNNLSPELEALRVPYLVGSLLILQIYESTVLLIKSYEYVHVAKQAIFNILVLCQPSRSIGCNNCLLQRSKLQRSVA